MFGWIKIMPVVVTPVAPVDEAEAQVFLDHYHPQVVLVNRFMANNHKHGTRDYDAAPWNEKAKYRSVAEGSADSWAAHMRRTLPKAMRDAWEADLDYRYNAWNYLDDYVNGWRHGFAHSKKMESLGKLKALLTREDWENGWMPSPIPTYPEHQIRWLQDLWSERTNFQGRKNQAEGNNPLAGP